MTMSIKALQKPVGQLEILVYIYKNKKAIHAGIVKNVGSCGRTTYSALENLIKLKLIRKVPEYIYECTEEGKKVARQLNKIEKLMSK